jgi:hypothetical protein
MISFKSPPVMVEYLTAPTTTLQVVAALLQLAKYITQIGPQQRSILVCSI